MANSNICLRHNCEQPPMVDVTVLYPPDLLKPDGKESKVSFCFDCLGPRVEAMFKTGNAISVAIERLASAP